ncbi:unnamed protein product, partial [Ectocarpus sp. 4 AP-2014]
RDVPNSSVHNELQCIRSSTTNFHLIHVREEHTTNLQSALLPLWHRVVENAANLQFRAQPPSFTKTAHTTPRGNKTNIGYKPLGKRKENNPKERTATAPTGRENSPRRPIKTKQNFVLLFSFELLH